MHSHPNMGRGAFQMAAAQFAFERDEMKRRCSVLKNELDRHADGGLQVNTILERDSTILGR